MCIQQTESLEEKRSGVSVAGGAIRTWTQRCDRGSHFTPIFTMAMAFLVSFVG